MTFLRILSPARWAMLAGTVALLIIAVLALSWCSERDRARQAGGKADLAAAQSGLGADALRRADNLAKAESENRAATQANTEMITGAENAGDDAGEAGRLGLVAWCRRQEARGVKIDARCSSK